MNFHIANQNKMGDKLIKIYVHPSIVDAARGRMFKRAPLSLWERFLIFIGLKEEPEPIRIKPKSIIDLLPKVKAPKFKTGRIGKIT